MKLTIIIPTYRRIAVLFQAIKSLQEQTLSDFEIIVVDNAADSAIEEKIAEFNRTAKCKARYVAEPELGLHNARHAGARAATGDVLVFTDDDATFDPGWLQAYQDAFLDHPEMVASGGPVRPVWEMSPPLWIFDYMNGKKTFPILSLMEPFDTFQLSSGEFFFGVNMAIRRTILFQMRGFNPECFGDTWLGDGESGLNRKLLQADMLIGYVPGALVYHHIPPTRMTFDYFCRRLANEGACTEYAAFHSGVPGLPMLLLRLSQITLDIMRSMVKLLQKQMLKRYCLSPLEERLLIAYHFSRMRYVLRLVYNQKLHDIVIKKDWL